MRKLFNFFAAALVVLAAVSCEKNEVLPDSAEGKVVTLNVSINNGGTKTYLGQGEGDPIQYPVYWSEGDAIAVINNGKLFKFVVDPDDADATQGTLTCTEPDGFDENIAVQAFYPYEGVTYDKGVISYTVPAIQTYQTNTINEVECSSFGQVAMPMAGFSENADGVVSFDNLFGVVKLQLKCEKNERVRSIAITSSNAISGASALTITESVKSISFKGTADSKVVLDCGTGVELNATDATEFLIAVPAGATGLNVLINTDKGFCNKEIPIENANSEPINVVTAGNILKMAECSIVTGTTENSYIENGVYYGEAITLPAGIGKSIVWAPVNCGYDANHRYGLLYQWGRKYGQGYAGEIPAAVLKNEQLTSADAGSDENYKDNFYFDNSVWAKGWQDASQSSVNLWNNVPGKTDYDPCPSGWRVPTIDELVSLKSGLSFQWTDQSDDSNHIGLPGFWFYEAATGNSVFFPAAGIREFSAGGATGRDTNDIFGFYWSSSLKPSSKYVYVWFFSDNGSVYRDTSYPAPGMSVRCVKVETQPVSSSN